MTRLLALAALRFYGRHPWQLVLAIAGISLGVAVSVGVNLANDSARRAFESSTEILQGKTTHRLLPVGGTLAEEVFVRLVKAGRATHAAPVLETRVRLDTAAAGYPLLGIDPIEESAFRGFAGFVPGRNSDLTRLMTVPGTVMLPDALARARGLAPGDVIDLSIGGRAHRVEVVGTVDALDGGAEGEPPIIADISTAQELTGREGRLDRIDLVLDAAQAHDLAAHPPPGTTLVTAGSENRELAQMTRAFSTNLTALGLLALVVGMFLIYATIAFAIVQRRPVIGMLRAIGVGRRRLLGGFLIEALGIGVVGTLLGLALGHLLATGLVGLVLRTIGDLYFSASLGSVSPSPWIYVEGAALGVGAALLAAIGPAIGAAWSEPDTALRRGALERKTLARSSLAAWLALPAAGLAAGLLWLDTAKLVAAFAALFLVLCAGALLIPLATRTLMRALAPIIARTGSLAGLMAVRGVVGALSRTGVATAALAVAVATVIGIGLMIASFRLSLSDWLDGTLSADLYLTLDGDDRDPGLDPATLAALEGLPEVEALSRTRFTRLPTELGELGLRATELSADGWGLDIVAGDAASAKRRLLTTASVLVSEPFAYRLGLKPGDSIDLPTGEGARPFTIAGVFRDYNTGGGSLVMDLGIYRQYWNDEGLTGVGVRLRPQVESTAGEAAVRAAIGGDSGVRIRSSEAIKRLSLMVFDRTFRITEVLRLLAGVVAFLGVLSAVLAIELERAREYAILRSIGLSARNLGVLIVAQTGLLGLAAGLFAVPLGTVLAGLLVYVINRRSFGWSMDLVLTPSPLALGVALALGAALLAGIYPAIRGSRTNLDAALRDE